MRSVRRRGSVFVLATLLAVLASTSCERLEDRAGRHIVEGGTGRVPSDVVPLRDSSGYTIFTDDVRAVVVDASGRAVTRAFDHVLDTDPLVLTDPTQPTVEKVGLTHVMVFVATDVGRASRCLYLAPAAYSFAWEEGLQFGNARRLSCPDRTLAQGGDIRHPSLNWVGATPVLFWTETVGSAGATTIRSLELEPWTWKVVTVRPPITFADGTAILDPALDRPDAVQLIYLPTWNLFQLNIDGSFRSAWGAPGTKRWLLRASDLAAVAGPSTAGAVGPDDPQVRVSDLSGLKLVGSGDQTMAFGSLDGRLIASPTRGR